MYVYVNSIEKLFSVFYNEKNAKKILELNMYHITSLLSIHM